MIDPTVDPARSEYRVFTGIQIHTPEGRQFVWQGTTYVVTDGKQLSLSDVKQERILGVVEMNRKSAAASPIVIAYGGLSHIALTEREQE